MSAKFDAVKKMKYEMSNNIKSNSGRRFIGVIKFEQTSKVIQRYNYILNPTKLGRKSIISRHKQKRNRISNRYNQAMTSNLFKKCL